jgi:hypothetical protein
MPDSDAQHDFRHYLLCDLPLGYPSKVPVAKLLDATMMSTRRDLLHQQDEFLESARAYLGAQPWIAYLATVKHEAVLVLIPTYADRLVDIVDQHFFRELQEKYRDLRAAARAAIDDATALTCERLVLLQSEAPQIEDALKSVSGAIEAGFATLEPLPSPPPEPVPAQRDLLYLLVAGVAFLVLGAIVPPEFGGMAWAVLGLIVTVATAVRVVGKERSRVKKEGAPFKSYMIHESYYALCKKSVALVLALPFEIRTSALTNLPPCKTALELLPPEREAMEAAYIRPFISN